jgi:Short C-terminal domain
VGSRATAGIRLPQFSSQLGGVDVSRLPVVSGVSGTKTSPEPIRQPATEQLATTSRASAGHEDIVTAIEPLAELHARGVLTEAEFSTKKAELLDRL